MDPLDHLLSFFTNTPGRLRDDRRWPVLDHVDKLYDYVWLKIIILNNFITSNTLLDVISPAVDGLFY